MDSNLWRHLPTELIIKIVEMSCPSIDVRLSFGIKPGKLDEAKCWRLWYFLKSHDGLVYNLESQSLHIFRIRGHHIIRRPIELNYHTAGLLIFNDSESEHVIEETQPNGVCTSQIVKDTWITNSRVIFRGSQPFRLLKLQDAMFNL